MSTNGLPSRGSRKAGAALGITTGRFARSVVLEGEVDRDADADADASAYSWLFEDNWFDLLPGERKVVRVLGEHARGRITAGLGPRGPERR